MNAAILPWNLLLWNRNLFAGYERAPRVGVAGPLPAPRAAARGVTVTPKSGDGSASEIPAGAAVEAPSRGALEGAMASFLAGDVRGFEALYRALAPRVRGFLRALSGDERVAEDLTQVTFLKVHRARHTYLLDAPVEPWVFAIARRSYFDHRRARKRRPEDLSADGQVPDAPLAVEAPEGFDRLDAGALDALLAGLDALPEAQREAVVLLKVKGLSVADAAQIAGVTPGALKVRAHRGYEALRKAMGVRRPA